MQLGVSLNDADTRDIVAFLESLTGERGEFRHCPGSSVRRRHGSENSGRRLLRIKLWLRERTDVNRPFICRETITGTAPFLHSEAGDQHANRKTVLTRRRKTASIWGTGEQSGRKQYRYLARRLTRCGLRLARLHDPGADEDPFCYGVTAFGNLVDSPWLHGLKTVAVAVVARVV